MTLNTTYLLSKTLHGNKRVKPLWHCHVKGSRIVGAASRPELAIKDWHKQAVLWSRFKELK